MEIGSQGPTESTRGFCSISRSYTKKKRSLSLTT